MKTYVIGNENAVLGLSLVGIGGRVVRDATELNLALDQCMSDRQIALLLVTADVARFARERVEKLQVSSVSPLLVEVPGEGQDTGSLGTLKELVQRAVGVRLGGD